MEVRLFPNLRRPGVGLKPRREAQRPLLPQHARHCPVLEAGSSLGYLVYPPLEKHEAYWVAYDGDGVYRFVYYVNPSGAKYQGVFSVAISLSAGGTGMLREDVQFLTAAPATTREHALLMMQTFIVREDIGTPTGAITLRGAWNFQTPQGWDTVYTPIFNYIERPVVPMMVIRVETDWYNHETEFRYVLQAGQSISVAPTMPIGQVVFVPREPITLRDCTDKELEEIQKSVQEFSREKAATKVSTPYGLQYSPHYLRKSREQNAPGQQIARDVATEPEKDRADVPAEEAAPASGETGSLGGAAAWSDSIPQKVGRNDPCPCGSGKKYKRCHGAAL